MNINHLLENLSVSSKDNLIRGILRDAYGDGPDVQEVTPSGKLPDKFAERLRYRVKLAASIAGDNREVVELLACSVSEERLDGAIHDACASLSRRINNGGTDSQVRYLLVEEGWSTEDIVSYDE